MKPLSIAFISHHAMSAEASKCAYGNRRQLYTSGIRPRRSVLIASMIAISLFTTMPACLVSAFATPSVTTTKISFATHTRRNSGSCSSQLSASGGNNKNLSSAGRERRDEDRRRNERKDDVVIGKTSARRDASDYPIDPEATEREFLRRASREERLIHQYTGEGMNEMKSLRLELADKYFDKVFELRPEAYLWQAGIVKFYLGNIEGASKIFANNALHFETKFGPMGMGPASEERIWRNAAELKYIHSLKKSQRKQYLIDKEKGITPIAQIEEKDDNDESTMGPETRMIHRLARELFDASIDQRKPAEMVHRAKLLSFAGTEGNSPRSKSDSTIKPMSLDIKKRKLNACYFLALHYDVTGDFEESKKWIKIAFKLCSMNAGKSSDIMDTLPLLHMTVRDWFDDDPFDEEDIEEFGSEEENFEMDDQKATTSFRTTEHMSDAYSDPLLEASIMEDVGKMTFNDIRDALRIRGISATGSKETLKERLFISLMDDAGYQSGFSP